MAVDYLTNNRMQQPLGSASHWDRISWEDFFHPDWEDDAPGQRERMTPRPARMGRSGSPATRSRLASPPIGLSRRAIHPITGGVIVTGAVVAVVAALALSKLASLLSNY